MRLSSYPFPEGLKTIPEFDTTKTSTLLDQGLVVKLPYAGVPLYTPIGQRVLNKIEEFIEEKFSASGFQLLQLPELIRTEDLEGGDVIGPQFASKFIHLQSPQKEYHLLTTPEMTLIRALGSTFSHSQLPIRLSYTANFFRNANGIVSFLTCKQFRIFGALCIESDTNNVSRSMELMNELLSSILSTLGIPIHTKRQNDGSFEVFLPSAEGDYRADQRQEENNQSSKKLLSLGMSFQYGKDIRLPIRMRTPDNRNAPIYASTFGLCTNRVLFATFDANRTPEGFRLPLHIRPFDISIIPVTKEQFIQAERLQKKLEAENVQVALDDRLKVTRTNRIEFAKKLGIPIQVCIQPKGLKFYTLQTTSSQNISEDSLINMLKKDIIL